MRTREFLIAVAGCLLLSFAAPALGAEGGEQKSIFEGSIGNFIFTLIIFGLVIFILGKFAWGPILNVLNEREKRIRESLEAAQRDRDESERVLEKYTQQLEQARTEAAGIIERGRKNAEEVGRRVQEQAREEGAQMVERARREIQLATDAAKKEVYDIAAELAVDVAGRIIKKELSAEDHKGLVSESLERMRDENAKLN